jgi:hypothetical protein
MDDKYSTSIYVVLVYQSKLSASKLQHELKFLVWVRNAHTLLFERYSLDIQNIQSVGLGN